MQKITGKWLWIVCALLILLNFYSLFERNKTQQEYEGLQIEHKNLTESYNITNRNIQKRTILQLQSENKALDVTQTLSSPSLEDTLILKDFLTEKKLIFKYSDGVDCQVCVDQIFAKLDSLNNLIGKEHILLLANYSNPRDLYTFKRTNNIDQPIYNLANNQLGVPAEQASVPLFLVACPNGETSHIFLPDKSMPKLTDEYFKLIQSVFENN